MRATFAVRGAVGGRALRRALGWARKLELVELATGLEQELAGRLVGRR